VLDILESMVIQLYLSCKLVSMHSIIDSDNWSSICLWFGAVPLTAAGAYYPRQCLKFNLGYPTLM